MSEIFFLALAFAIGSAVGTSRAKNAPESERLSNLQHLLNESYEREQLIKDQWLQAEDRAETWKRRYDNILPLTQSSFEE